MNKSFLGLSLLFLLAFLSASIAQAQPTGIETLGSARFTVITPQLIRMEYAPDGKFVDAPSWFATHRDVRFTDYKTQCDDQSLTIDTGVIRLVYQNDGKAFNETNLKADIKKSDAMVAWHADLPQTGNLGGANRTLDRIVRAVPITDGVVSRDGWYLLDDSTSVLAVGDWFQDRPANNALDWYLFGYGLDYKAALKSLTTLSGSIPLPRKYTMGLWYSRYWPYSADEFKQIVNEYHQHDFPLDVLVMDMDWHGIDTNVPGVKRAYLKEIWTGYTWNKSLIPDPAALLKWLHDKGLAVTLNDHPADGVQPHEEMYAAFMHAMGADPATGQTLPFDAGDKHYLDTFYQYTHVPREKEGVDFWWLDWQQYPQTKSLPDLTNLAMLNDYYFKHLGGDGKRGQSFSRWAGWGDQRNPIHFSGDANTGWKMLAFEVPFTSTSSNVGCFFWTHDIGGHMGGRNEESYTRWCQFGALTAALRSHSTRDAQMDRRPWSYPDWAEKSMRLSFHLRAELLPYIYSSAWHAIQTSVPFLRAMYIDHPEQEPAYHNGQQYYLGDNLLVAPIAMPGVGPNRIAWQHVWFPEGNWFQYFTGEKYTGPSNVLAAADINEFPLFVRGGVPLPEQPYVERPATTPLTHLVLRCYPGQTGQTGTYSLYEDDGISNDYTRSKFAATELSYTRDGTKITVRIAPTQGSYQGQPAKRSYTILLPNTQKGTLQAPASAQLSYDDATKTNRVEIPATAISQETVLTLDADEFDADQLHRVAVARRMSGLLGKPYEEWAAKDKASATPETVEAVQAVQGVGIIPVNQHAYLLGDDVRLVYFNSENKSPINGQLSYKSWSKPVTLTPGEAIDTSGLEDAVPPQDVVFVPGMDHRLTVATGPGGSPLSVDISELGGALGNLAPEATVSVGSGKGEGLNDGSAEGFPGSQATEWIVAPNKKPDWAQLTWEKPVKAKRILLYDRPNPDDHVLAGKLTFSDGTSQNVGPLPNDGKTPLDISFPEKEITWVKFEIIQASPQTQNIGLAEIAVFDR